MPTQHIQQIEECGCAPASFAMLTGWTYDEAKRLWPFRNFSKSGVKRHEIWQALAHAGFAVARVEGETQPLHQLNLLETQDEGQVTEGKGFFHYSVLLGDGTVLDPLRTSPSTVNDYHKVLAVTAVIPY